MDSESIRLLRRRREKFTRVVTRLHRLRRLALLGWVVAVAAIVAAAAVFLLPSSEARQLTAARDFFLDRAREGNAYIQNDVGSLMLSGVLFERDVPNGIAWLQQAAQQGQADAMNNLGMVYSKGVGVPLDLNKAREWFQKAADQGSVAARANLQALPQ